MVKNSKKVLTTRPKKLVALCCLSHNLDMIKAVHVLFFSRYCTASIHLITRYHQGDTEDTCFVPRRVLCGLPALAGDDTVITDVGKEYRLKEALESLNGDYII